MFSKWEKYSKGNASILLPKIPPYKFSFIHLYLEYRWFHGKITREKAEELLKPYEEGLFLVRESHNYQGDYTLSVWYVCRVVSHWVTLSLFRVNQSEVGVDLEALARERRRNCKFMSTVFTGV